MSSSVAVESLSFSTSHPDEKLRIGRALGKVVRVAGKVLPIASTFVPALVPINNAVQAGKQIAGALRR
jgi:hypothetical protein